MKSIIVAFSLSLLTSPSFGKTVKGTVRDSLGKAIPYADVMLCDTADSTYVTGTVTDDNGHFLLSAGKDEYVIKVRCVGYKDMYIRTRLDDLSLTLQQSTTSLRGITVSSRRTIYEQTAEGLRTNVAGTILAKMGTAKDVLSHVPGVLKKKDGFEVFGKGTPLIYLNGKKLQTLEELDELKSQDIKSVEVIRNPGSAYDASVASVIKIRTVRVKGEGFGGDLRSVYYYNKYHNTIQQLRMNYHHDGLTLFTTYKFSDWKEFEDGSVDQRTYVDTLWNQQNVYYGTTRNEYHKITGGFSYDFSPTQSIGAKYDLGISTYQKEEGSNESKVTADGQPYDRIGTLITASNKDKPSHLLNVYYNGALGKTSIDFNTDFLINHTHAYSRSAEHSEDHDSRVVDSENKVRNSMIASKLILDSPLFSGTMRWGAEYVSIHRKDRYEVNRTDLLDNSDSKLTEQTASPFIEYSHETPIGTFQAGLRFEYVRFKYYDNGMYQSSQSRTFRNWFPSLNYGTQVGKVDLQLSYSVKTRRPSYSQLSNNVQYLNRFSLQTGNPLLDSEINHTVELSGVWKFFQFSVDYLLSKNPIIYWSRQLEKDPSVNVIYYHNIKRLRGLNAYVSAAPTIGIWSPQVSFGVNTQWLTLHTQRGAKKLNRPQLVGSLSNSFTLPWNLQLSVDYQYQGTGNWQNAWVQKPLHIVNVSLVKSFLKDKLTVQVQGNDLLHQQWDGGTLYTPRMTYFQLARTQSRDITLTLRYNFRTTKGKYKGTGAGEEQQSRM